MAVVTITTEKEEVRRRSKRTRKSTEVGGPRWIVRLNEQDFYTGDSCSCLVRGQN